MSRGYPGEKQKMCVFPSFFFSLELIKGMLKFPEKKTIEVFLPTSKAPVKNFND